MTNPLKVQKESGKLSWTVLAAWGTVVLGILQVMYDSPLFDRWDGWIVVVIGVLFKLLRIKTVEPLK